MVQPMANSNTIFYIRLTNVFADRIKMETVMPESLLLYFTLYHLRYYNPLPTVPSGMDE